MDEQEQQPQEQQEMNQVEPTPLAPPPSHKKLVIGVATVFVLLVAGIAGAYFFVSQGGSFAGCTEEGKMCPDGSMVVRVAPLCKFAECPEAEQEESVVEEIIQTEGFDDVPAGDIKFTGVILKRKDTCQVDGICSFIIGNQEVIWGQGWPREARGSFDSRTVDIGDRVEVYGKKISDVKVTIYGSEEYYIKKIKLQTSVDTPDSSTVLTADWQTYRNEEYGFEVKHPSDFIARPTTRTYIEPRYAVFAIEQSEDQWMEVVIYESAENAKLSLPTNPTNPPRSTKTIGSLPTYYQSYPAGSLVTDIAEPQYHGALLVLWTQKNNELYVLRFHNVEKLEGVYDQILSTFKFIEPQPQ